MPATIRSMSRLSGSIRKPTRMVASPPTTTHAVTYSSGDASAQWRASRVTAPRSAALTAAMERPAESRGRRRVQSMIATKAANGSQVASPATARVGSESPAAGMAQSVVR